MNALFIYTFQDVLGIVLLALILLVVGVFTGVRFVGKCLDKIFLCKKKKK